MNLKLQYYPNFLVLITLSLSCSDFQADLAIFPDPQNITVGLRAIFTCGGTGKSITWFINDTLLDEELADNLSIIHDESSHLDRCSINSTISILGAAASNNTRVRCLLSAGGLKIEESDNVVLKVQGVPCAVFDLRIIHDDSNRHRLSWSAPNSLHGINTSYYVSVNDESKGGERIVIAVSGTLYHMQLIPCHSYTFAVVPWNEAGNGTMSNLRYFYPGAPISPDVDNITISSLALNVINGLVITTLQYPVTSTCYSHQNISVHASTLGDYGSVFDSVSQVDNNVVSVAIDGMPLNKVLSMNLVLSNEFGLAPVHGGVLLRTYNTQGVALTRNHQNGTSCFRCVFLHNSQTHGCLLKLVSHSTGPCYRTRNIVLPQTNCSTSEMCFDEIYQGMYNIEVYDILNSHNGSMINSRQPQVLSNIEIQGISCIQTIDSTMSTITPNITATLSKTESPVITVGSVETNGSIRTAGVLVGVFGGMLIIVIALMFGIFIYRKRHMAGGSLRINQSVTSSVEDTKTRIPATKDNEMSGMPSLSSLGPPPYQGPVHVGREDLDQNHPTEQYIIMHSASTRSPSASNSTSSHLGLVQGSNTSQKDFTTSGHYDHLQQLDEDFSKKHLFGHLLKSNNDRYSFELKPYYRNEHLV